MVKIVPAIQKPYQFSSVLLISPRTYNYHEILFNAFTDAGVACCWLDERPFSHPLFKLFSRVLNSFARYLSVQRFKSRIDSVFSSGFLPTHVVIVKGEAVHPSVIVYLRSLFPAAKYILYFWDSVSNLPGHTTIVPLFDVVATFDFRDSVSHSWIYYPLFSGNCATKSHPSSRSAPSASTPLYDWSFVGAAHSDRLIVLDRLFRQSEGSLEFFIYLYFPSLLHFCFFLIRSPLQLIHLHSHIHFRPLPATDLSRVYNSSRCILDIHHPSQTGLTIRTVESIISGLKVATTNCSISQEPFYSPDRVLIIDRSSPCIPYSFLKSIFSPLSEELAASYRPNHWVLALLSL